MFSNYTKGNEEQPIKDVIYEGTTGIVICVCIGIIGTLGNCHLHFDQILLNEEETCQYFTHQSKCTGSWSFNLPIEHGIHYI